MKIRITEEELKNIQTMVDSGATNAEIAEKYGYSKCRISQIITHKLHRTYTGKLLKNDIKILTSMVDDGCTSREIGDLLGCSKSTISRYVKKLGLKLTMQKKYKVGEIEYLQHLWNDCGLTYDECADRMHVRCLAIKNLICRLRKKGYKFDKRINGYVRERSTIETDQCA